VFISGIGEVSACNNNKNNNNLDNEKGTCMLIDVAMSGDRYVIKKRSREDSKI